LEAFEKRYALSRKPLFGKVYNWAGKKREMTMGDRPPLYHGHGLWLVISSLETL
jgi:fido (protein-threonine AMPylation protein)